MMLRLAFALPLILAALPAFAADPAPPADPLESALVTEWSEADRAHTHAEDAVRRMLNDRRVLRAQLARAIELCAEKCQPQPAAPPAAQAEPAAPPAEPPAP